MQKPWKAKKERNKTKHKNRNLYIKRLGGKLQFFY